MSNTNGPITLVTSISDQRNRWKALAYAWKGVAMQVVDSCSVCGAPALWRGARDGIFWCETHWESASPDVTEGAEKLPWHLGLLKALDLEDMLSGAQEPNR